MAPPPRGDDEKGQNVTTKNTAQNLWGYSTPSPIDHDYTYCCSKKKVYNLCKRIYIYIYINISCKLIIFLMHCIIMSKQVTNKCIGFCDVSNILDGTTGNHPSECEDDFPKIVECMAGNYPTLNKRYCKSICQRSLEIPIFI